jgi:hypothetical protein
MLLAPFDLAGARLAVESLLERLDLDAFIFAVDHTTRGWELRVECAIEGGWQAETIVLGNELPGPGPEDAPLRDRLVNQLRDKLAACKRHA